MRVFAMITTRHSSEYTGYALESFFHTSRLEPGEKLFLIDNDGTVAQVKGLPRSEVEILSNPTPKSFAENVNMIIERARASSSDVFFLNNDLIFTEGWLEPLLVAQPALLSPVSNREIQLQTQTQVWKNALALPDYLGREEELAAVVREYRAHAKGYQPVIALPFFCIKIPFAVYSAVGLLDESFGRGGAEDNDYCIRVCLAGFPICYALQSYVLHFSGKSTWSGAETKAETDARCGLFREVFEKKWGPRLLDVYINEKMDPITGDPELAALAGGRKFKELLERLAKKE